MASKHLKLLATLFRYLMKPLSRGCFVVRVTASKAKQSYNKVRLPRRLRLLAITSVVVIVGIVSFYNLKVARGAVFNSYQTGNWSDQCTWSATCNGGLPASGDNVTIVAGHVVTILASNPVNIGVGTLTINGTLTQNDVLTSGDLTIVNGGLLTTNNNALNTGSITITGTLTAGSNTITVNGSWTNTAGTFNYGTSTVKFVGTGSINTTNTAGKIFNNFMIDSNSNTVTLLSSSRVDGVLTLQSGMLSGQFSIYIYNSTASSFVNNGITYGASVPTIRFYINSADSLNPTIIPSVTQSRPYPGLSMGASAGTRYAKLNGNIYSATFQVNGLGPNSITYVDTDSVNNYSITTGSISVGRTGDPSWGHILKLNNSTVSVTGNDSIITSDITVENKILFGVLGYLKVGGDLINDDTIDMSAGGTLDVAGNFTNNATFTTSTTSKLNFTGTNSGKTIKTNSATLNNISLNSGLVGHWKLDEGTGTTAKDSSGYGNDGTLTGPTHLPTWTSAVKDSSYYGGNLNATTFDGTEDYINIPDNNVLNTGTSSFTAGAWVNLSTTSANRVVNKMNASQIGWLLDVNNDGGNTAPGYVRIRINDGTHNFTYGTNGSLGTGTWKYISAVFDRVNGQLKLYVNGSQIGTTQDISSVTGNISNTVGVGIANIPAITGSYFSGSIDDVRIYNRALSGAEITILYGGTNPTGGSWSLTDSTDINGNLNIASGTLINNNQSLNIAGDTSIAQNQTYTKGTGAVTFDGTTVQTFTDSSSGTKQNLGTVVLNKSSGTPANNKITLATSLSNGMKVDTLTINANNTLDLNTGGYTLDLANAGATATVLTNSGTLTPGTSTVKYSATNSSGNINVNTIPYSSLQISGAETYDMTGHLTTTSAMTGNLTIDTGATFNTYVGTTSYNLACINLIANGTLFSGVNNVTGASTLTVAGNWDSSAGTFTYGQSSLIFTGASKTITTTSVGNWFDYHFNSFTVNAGASISVNTASPAVGFGITGNLTISGTLTVPLTKKFYSANSNGLNTINSGGEIAGAGTFYKNIFNASQNMINNGIISVSTFYYLVGGGATTASITATTYGGDLKVGLSNSMSAGCLVSPGTLNIAGTMSLDSGNNGYLLTVDNTINNSNITVGAIVVGTSGQVARYNSFKPGNSTLNVNGDITVYPSDTSGDNLIDSTGNTTNWNISGNVLLSDIWTAGSSNITVGGNWDSSAGTFNYDTSTVAMSGGTATLKTNTSANVAFYKFIANSGSNVTVQNVGSPYSGAIQTTYSTTVNGTLTIPTNKYFGHLTSSTITINSGGVVTGGGYLSRYISNSSVDIVNNGTISVASVNYTVFQGTTTAKLTPITTSGNVHIELNGGSTAGSTAVISAGNFNVGGTITIRSSVAYPLIVDNTINDSSITAGAFLIGYSGQTGWYSTFKPGNSNITVNGDVTVYSSDASGDNLIDSTGKTTNWNISGNVNLQDKWTAGSSNITVGGNWDSSTGTFNYDTSTVTMSGATVNLTTSINASMAFYKFTINSGSNVTVQNVGGPFAGATQATNTVTISGTLTIPTGKYFSQYLNNAGLVINNSGTITGLGTYNRYVNNVTPDIVNNGTISVSVFYFGVIENSTAAKITPITTSRDVMIVQNSNGPSTAVISPGAFNVAGTMYIYGGNLGMTIDNTVNNVTFTTTSLYVGQPGQPTRYTTFKPGAGLINVNGNLIVSPSDSGGENKLEMGSGTWNVKGSWTNSDIVVAGTSTINFTSTATGKTVTSGTGGFNNINFSGSGGGWTLQDTTSIAGNLTVSAGTLTGGTVTTTVSGNIDFTGGTFTRSSSTIVMNGSGKTLVGAAQSLNNLQISGTVTNQTSQTKVYGTLTVDNTKTFTVNYLVSVLDGTTVINGTINGSSVLELYNLAGANLSTGGTLSVNTKFISSSTNVVIPTRVYGGNLSYQNTAASNYSAVVGTGSGQTISANYLTIFANGTGNATVDASINNPTINISHDIGYFGTGTGTESIKMGSGTWSVGNNLDLRNGTLDAGTSLLKFTATWPNVSIYSNSQSFYNVEFNGVGGGWILQDDLDVNGDFKLQNGTLATGNKNINVSRDWNRVGGVFTVGTSKVTLDSSQFGHIYGNNTFYDLVIDTTNATTNGAKSVNFAANSTQTIARTLTLNGGIGKYLTLGREGGTGSDYWSFAIPQGYDAGSYIDVNHSQTANSNKITANDTCLDSGSNPGWNFITDKKTIKVQPNGQLKIMGKVKIMPN